jgi:predicted Zn-dependent protease with MMP-like domain
MECIKLEQTKFKRFSTNDIEDLAMELKESMENIQYVINDLDENKLISRKHSEKLFDLVGNIQDEFIDDFFNDEYTKSEIGIFQRYLVNYGV